jgi:hypothetical protein
MAKFYSTGVQKQDKSERSVVIYLESTTRLLAIKEAREIAKQDNVKLDALEVHLVQGTNVGRPEIIPTVRLKDRIKAQRAAELKRKK